MALTTIYRLGWRACQENHSSFVKHGTILHNFLQTKFTIFFIYLEFFPWQAFPASCMFVGKAGAYPIEEPFRCSNQGLAPGLAHKK